MAKARRTLAREFGARAAELVTEQGYCCAAAARQLGIGENRIRNSKARFAADGGLPRPRPMRRSGSRGAPPAGRERAAAPGARHPKKATASFAGESIRSTLRFVASGFVFRCGCRVECFGFRPRGTAAGSSDNPVSLADDGRFRVGRFEGFTPRSRSGTVRRGCTPSCRRAAISRPRRRRWPTSSGSRTRGWWPTRIGASQYAGEHYQRLLAQRGIDCSTSRAGNSCDDARPVRSNPPQCFAIESVDTPRWVRRLGGVRRHPISLTRRPVFVGESTGIIVDISESFPASDLCDYQLTTSPPHSN